MITPTFRKMYGKLNREQKQAVDAIEGPVMVIAGPGTGKTQILTLRIANILQKTDTSPDSILALTFTESGVFSMRKRLVEIIGSAGYRVGIFTFHSFCNEVIRRFPDSFPKIIGANHLNDIEKISILKDIIEKSNLKKLKPFGDNFFYLNSIRSKISELKRENISPKRLKNLVKKQYDEFKKIDDLYHKKGAHKGKMKGKYIELGKKIEKNKELALIYGLYEKRLTEQRFYDYEDMIIETIKAFESDGDLLLSLQEEYQYILADEHQDANNSQNRLLELLASYHESPNLFIVGDEKQAIFRFQGASLENFLYFKNLYKDALSITLIHNYRSYQHILDSSHSLISKVFFGVKNLKGKKDTVENKIGLRAFSKQEYEYLFLSYDIKEKLDQGVRAEEIAVLYRDNNDVTKIIPIFEKNNIPFVVESDQNILLDKDIVKLIALLRAVNELGNDELLLPALHADFLKIDGLDIYKLSAFSKRRKINLYDILKSEKTLKKAGIEQYKKIYNLYKKINSWKSVDQNRSLTEFLEIVVKESGFLNHLLSGPEASEKISKLAGFFDAAKKLIENHRKYKLNDFIEHINLLEEHNILIKKDSKSIVPKKVRLMTAHKSKGLEFDWVFIVGACDRHWGNKQMIEHFKIPVKALEKDCGDNNDDDRRLFYVALTRARFGVNISYSKEGENGEQQLPSQFIEEIDSKYINEFNTESFENSVRKQVFLLPKKDGKISVKDKHFLNELFKEQGLSVTALNNYLECPWNYFYSSLLRIPKAPNKHMMFGTAVHKTLNDFFDKLQNGHILKKEKFLMIFEDYLKSQPFSESEYVEVLDKGVNALSGYYDEYIKIWKNSSIEKILKNEFKINVLFEGIRLKGNLDKIEILDSNNNVNVVDYKTGKPKSRNVIEGKTKTSNGNYKRQLVFYKLLLNLYDNGRFNMVSGEIDFVEPDKKGKYHKEKFLVSEEEIKDLKKTIKNTAREILSLSFWDKKCNNKKCSYCRIREMME